MMSAMAEELISIERARELVVAEAEMLPSESVGVADLVGRTLATPLESAEPVPGFENSAMDGFAVRAADTEAAPEARLRVVAEARAGHPAGRSLEPGEAIAISTGAPVPVGADAVVRVEDTERDGDAVRVAVAVEVGRNLRAAGEDIEVGDLLLAAGSELGPAAAGVIASVGVRSVPCTRRPRVAVLCTGDELVGAEEELFEGAVRNSNALTIPALARAAGATVEVVERVPDDPVATLEAIRTGLDADLLAICGGVSVGEHDHVKGALAELGVDQIFWGVSLKPGKPTYFGAGPKGLVFGLPGNPVSAFVTFLLFARPALLAMAGHDPSALRVEAELAEGYEKPTDRAHAVRCRVELGDSGWVAHPMSRQGSHVLTSMLGADGLAMIARERGRVEAGERVAVELLEMGQPLGAFGAAG